jgi:hypothetical protein
MKEGIQSLLSDFDLKNYGCAFLAAEKLMNDKSEDIKKVLDDYAILKGKKIIGEEAYINSWQLLAEYFDYTFIGKRNDNADNKNCIIKRKKTTETGNYTHFVAMINGKIWDSLPPNRPANKGYKDSEFYFFRKIKNI